MILINEFFAGVERTGFKGCVSRSDESEAALNPFSSLPTFAKPLRPREPWPGPRNRTEKRKSTKLSSVRALAGGCLAGFRFAPPRLIYKEHLR
jgi:hypothetical protein